MVLSMEKWCGKVAVVTGASAGCGAAIVKQLVEAGMLVVGLARRLEKLESIAESLKEKPGKFFPFKCDITVEDDILSAFKWTKCKVGPVGVLVNNAGISQPTTLSSGSTEMWKKVLDTNVLGLCIATREAITIMNENDIPGHIIHINSVLGHYVAHLPGINMYPASKFAVTALTETLRQEFLAVDSKIRISSVSPGPVDTEFVTANLKNPEEVKEFMEIFKKMPKLMAEDVADAVTYILSTPPYVQVQDIMIRPLGEPV